MRKSGRIREKGYYSLQITAYAVTALFIAASLVPLAWMISSSLKDGKSIYAFPPRWIPKVPQTVTVALDFSGMAQQDRQAFEAEAAKATWFAWKKLQNESIGEMRVVGTLNGRKVLEAQTPSYLFTAGRTQIVPAQVFTDAIMRIKLPIIRSNGYTHFRWYGDEGAEVRPQPDAAEPPADSPAGKVREFLQQAKFMKAKLVSVTQQSNWLRLFDNYITLWTMNAKTDSGFDYPKYLLNSAVVTGATIAFHFFVGGLAGYALSRLISRKWAARWMLFFVATIMIPEIAILVPLYLTMEKLHLVNTLWAIILPHSAWGIVIFLFKGFFDQLPGELLQAARIDGASELRIYNRLVIPLSLPIFTVVGVMTFLAVWNEFLWPLVVARQEPVWTLTVAINDFQNRQSIGPNVLMASLTVATLPTLAVFLFCQRLIEKGVAWTGVKG
jgi:multiple sugar transport system permease protein